MKQQTFFAYLMSNVETESAATHIIIHLIVYYVNTQWFGINYLHYCVFEDANTYVCRPQVDRKRQFSSFQNVWFPP